MANSSRTWLEWLHERSLKLAVWRIKTAQSLGPVTDVVLPLLALIAFVGLSTSHTLRDIFAEPLIILLLGYVIFTNKIPGLSERDKEIVDRAMETGIRQVMSLRKEVEVIGEVISSLQEFYQKCTPLLLSSTRDIYTVFHGVSVLRV